MANWQPGTLTVLTGPVYVHAFVILELDGFLLVSH